MSATEKIKQKTAELQVLTGPLFGQVFELVSGEWPRVIGRSREKTDIAVPDPAVSRRHAELSYRDGQWALRDLNSSNGTFVNEQRITRPILLRHHDQIRCGGTVFLYESDAESDVLRLDETEDRMIELVFHPGETMVSVAFNSLQTKEAARRRQRMAEAGQAAMNLSHGIKNILQAVSTGIDVVDQGFETGQVDQARRGWQILKRNLAQVQKLVLDMLKFSKDQPLNLQPCQINRLMETVLELVHPTAFERSVSVTSRPDERLGLVLLDPDRMQDVLLNLLLNAVEAVEPGAGQVTVATEAEVERRQLVIRVSDNGPGIEDTEAIFKPFHSSKGKIGTGLGLPIARKIVEDHGGRIEVRSLLDEGTHFIVILPWREPEQGEEPL